MRVGGVLIAGLVVVASACSSTDPTASDEHVELEPQLSDVTAERDALAAEIAVATGRYEKARATQDALYPVIQNPANYGTEEEVLDLLDTFATPDVMTGDMAWGDSLGPWWREGWNNTLFGGANATLKTWEYWLSDDGSVGGSLWTWSGTAVNGEPFDIQGVELSRYNEDGLYTELVMFYPYENQELHRRFNEGN
jgi:hypothetical protein